MFSVFFNSFKKLTRPQQKNTLPSKSLHYYLFHPRRVIALGRICAQPCARASGLHIEHRVGDAGPLEHAHGPRACWDEKSFLRCEFWSSLFELTGCFIEFFTQIRLFVAFFYLENHSIEKKTNQRADKIAVFQVKMNKIRTFGGAVALNQCRFS